MCKVCSHQPSSSIASILDHVSAVHKWPASFCCGCQTAAVVSVSVNPVLNNLKFLPYLTSLFCFSYLLAFLHNYYIRSNSRMLNLANPPLDLSVNGYKMLSNFNLVHILSTIIQLKCYLSLCIHEFLKYI